MPALISDISWPPRHFVALTALLSGDAVGDAGTDQCVAPVTRAVDGESQGTPGAQPTTEARVSNRRFTPLAGAHHLSQPPIQLVPTLHLDLLVDKLHSFRPDTGGGVRQDAKNGIQFLNQVGAACRNLLGGPVLAD